jgi:NTE family protein
VATVVAMTTATRALVLAGGGLTGIGWEVGVLAGLAEFGMRPGDDADLIIGTSAGSVVGARVAQGADLEALFAEQLAKEAITNERPVSLEGELFGAILEEMMSVSGDPAERHARVGALALGADTISEEERLAVVAGRLASTDWPDRRLQIVAVDAVSGETAVFEPDSGVPLVLAVAASCAVPGIWPPTTIDGRRYIDGGVRSPDNADLAAGFDRVLVLSPARLEIFALPVLEATGSVAVIYPDDDALVAMGANPLDPTLRAPAARAGRAQAEALARDLGEFWAD